MNLLVHLSHGDPRIGHGLLLHNDIAPQVAGFGRVTKLECFQFDPVSLHVACRVSTRYLWDLNRKNGSDRWGHRSWALVFLFVSRAGFSPASMTATACSNAWRIKLYPSITSIKLKLGGVALSMNLLPFDMDRLVPSFFVIFLYLYAQCAKTTLLSS